MRTIDPQEIINIFRRLNESGLNYILIRNINNELPFSLETGKDIDLLVCKEDVKSFVKFFQDYNYKKTKHPLRNDTFLYGVKKFEFYYNENNKIIFDLNFDLAVRSLDAGQWIPLDKMIQRSAWRHRRFNKVDNHFGFWTLGHEDEFVTLVARAIFDKRKFQQGYIRRINELLAMIDKEEVEKRFRMVFFKYTPLLMTQLLQEDYHKIIERYLSFRDY